MAARSRILIAGGVIAAAALAAYGNSLRGPFVFDDIGSIAGNPTLRRLGSLAVLDPPRDITVGGRPILNLSLALNYALGGTEVWGYHAANLLIHVLCGLLLFGIVRRTLARSGAPAAGGALASAFAAALLWTVHPLQTEAVTYVIQRAESLMALFYLLTLYGFIRALEAGAARSRAAAWLALSWLSCLLGMGTKEVMVSAPLIVLLYDRTFAAGSFRAAWRARRGYYLALAATWIPLALLVAQAGNRGGSASFEGTLSWMGYARIQAYALVRYLRLAVWPRPLVFFYGSAAVGGKGVLALDSILVAGLAAATVAALVRRPRWGFLGACFFAILAPSSSIVPVLTETMAEHRVYLALAPLAVAAVLAIRAAAGRRLGLALVLICAAALAAATRARNAVYATGLSLWSDTVAKVPNNAVARNNLGAALAAAGRLGPAEEQFAAAVRLSPNYADGWNNLGVTALELGRPAEALADYAQALRYRPDEPRAHFNLGVALAQLGRAGEAIGQYREALRIDPDYPSGHYNLGTVLLQQDRAAEAVPELRRALQADPRNPAILTNLGAALANSGHPAEARAQFEAALRLQPGYELARQDLQQLEAMAGGR